MRIAPVLPLLTAVLACALSAAPAQAQRDRVFVASYGSDSNPCTFGSPCKTFQNAVNVVAVGGEVTAIDSAGFGPITISHAVTITSPNGVEAGIAAAAGDNGITINATSSDTVVLSGLTLEGAASGANGISFTGGGKLEVINCAIRNYTSDGISIAPQSGSPTILIENTYISDNASFGIDFGATAGSIQAAVNGVTSSGNGAGLGSVALSGPIEVQIADSHFDNNVFAGIESEGTSGADSSTLVLKYVTLNQEPYGVELGNYTTVWLSHVIQTSVSGFTNTGGVSFVSNTGSAANSDGTNLLMGGVMNGMLGSWTPQ
jgi:hypothetical protein